MAGTSFLGSVYASILEANKHQKEVWIMNQFIETVFGNQFFQLPFLEALSYIFAGLLIGAIVVSLTRRALGMSAQRSEAAPSYSKRPVYGEEDTWEWRKAA